MEINYGNVSRFLQNTVASPYEALIKPSDEEKKEAVLAQKAFKLLGIYKQKKETDGIRF